MPQVLFAGYKVPHPLEPYFIIKLQTDGTITPQDILEQATKDLIGTLATLETKFKKEFQMNEANLATGLTGRGAQGDDPYATGATGEWGTGAQTARDYLDL